MIAGALGLGLLVGLALGGLGGGGSVLTVPALVLVLGLTAQEATTASLVIVGTTAAAATVGHARAGHTRWRAGALLALVGAPASLLGSVLNRRADQDVLLLAFAALVLVAAAGMLLRARSGGRGPLPRSPDAAPPAGGGMLTATRPRTRRVVQLVAAGLGIGLLTGFLGVGGGFVVVPVLVVLLGVPMPVAVGTSLLVISLNSAIALAARVGHGVVVWDVVVPFTAAAVAGSLAGERVAGRVDAARLTAAFAGLLVAVAVAVAAQAVLGAP